MHKQKDTEDKNDVFSEREALYKLQAGSIRWDKMKWNCMCRAQHQLIISYKGLVALSIQFLLIICAKYWHYLFIVFALITSGTLLIVTKYTYQVTNISPNFYIIGFTDCMNFIYMLSLLFIIMNDIGLQLSIFAHLIA